MILFIRSALFNAAFYLTTAAYLIVCSPLLFGPRKLAMAALMSHAKVCCRLLQVIAGTRLEVRGRERLPAGAVLVAAKHQSAWDTFGLLPLFHDPAMVLKAELGSIPLYGWFCRKFGMIFVAREKRAAALRSLLADAKDRANQGRHILIFPEGTRSAPGSAPDYKPGVAALYEGLGLPCVPIALNSGLFWPRRSFLRRPGTIVVEILPPIPAGIPRKTFMTQLQTQIETATEALVNESRPNVNKKSTRLEHFVDSGSDWR